MTPPTESVTKVPITRQLVLWTIVASLLLVFLHGMFHLVVRFRSLLPLQFRETLSVTNDQGLHSWLTITVMVILAFTCFVLAVHGPRLVWILTGTLFLGLSADDFTRFHEHVGEIAWPLLKTTIYSWLVVLGPILALCGIVVFLQLRKVFPDRRERLLLLAGFGSLAAALGMEALEGLLSSSGVTWRGIDVSRYGQPIEEFLELLGPVLLLHCTLGRLEQRGLFRSPDTAPPPAGAGD